MMEQIPQLSPQRLALHHEIFRSSLANAIRFGERNPEAAAGWALLSAEVADKMGCGRLMSAELEELLVKLAPRIPVPKRGRPTDRRRWLHVFSETYSIGGHTALAARWIALDSGQDRHSLVTTVQETADVPQMMYEAIISKGGSIHGLGRVKSLNERARLLREIAWKEADVVVLHIHMWDVVPVIAFGVPGGPPVLLLNHADHTFWVGAAVADRIINLRRSGQEVAEKWRGIYRHVYLPIPLPLLSRRDPNLGRAIRTELGIPELTPVFLTVGSHFKYLATGEVNFIDTACRLLKTVPDAYLIAVGPAADHADWQAARDVTGGRLMAVGPKDELAGYFAAADVYIEGFPFGSLTALLEAGLAGLPCVRAPILCPPPFTSDDEALDHLPQPSDLDDYISQATALATSPTSRRSQNKALKEAIGKVHLGTGWQLFLDEIKACLPAQHDIHQVSAPPFPSLWEQYWLPYLVRRLGGDPLLFFYVKGHRLGLAPRPSLRLLLTALRAAIPEHPHGTPGPIALGLFRTLIDPIANILPFANGRANHKWWPRLILDYWYGRYVGWRIKAVNEKSEIK
ncbi:MAG: hypothetical protein WBX11_14915 [Thiobacillaceae bacterium]